MAISETIAQGRRLDDDRRNQREGGVMGKKAKTGRGRPGISTGRLFAEKARGLISQDKVAGRVGCWTSVSRKSVNCRCSRKLNSLLFYPVQYEGEELGKERLLHRRGTEPASDSRHRIPDEQWSGRLGAKRWVLLGTGLRLSAHHEQDPARLPASRRASPTSDIDAKSTPPVRPRRLPNHRRAASKTFFVGGKKYRRRHLVNRRLERAVLQGARQSPSKATDVAGGGILGFRRGRAARRRY